MHNEHELVYHLAGYWFRKFDSAADAPHQNDEGHSQQHLLDIIDYFLSLNLSLRLNYPENCLYCCFKKANYSVSCIKATVEAVFWQSFCNQFKSDWKSKVAESEKPSGQIECGACGIKACLCDLVHKVVVLSSYLYYLSKKVYNSCHRTILETSWRIIMTQTAMSPEKFPYYFGSATSQVS